MNIDLSDIKPDITIPLTSRDQRFFSQISHFMDEESAKVGENSSKERFATFRLAFEKVK